MTQEEQNIKQKIENLSDMDMSDMDLYFDDTNLWHKLEERLDEKKPRKPKFLWLWWAAASLLIGVFFINKLDEKPKNQAINVSKVPVESTKSTPKRVEITQIKQINAIKEAPNELFFKLEEVRSQEELFTEKRMNAELSKIESKTKFDSLSVNKKTIAYQPKFQIQQVTIVDFPEIPDELMQRESFAKRAFRQLKSLNTEGKIDWRELNIEPRNVWAYMERNFKYDTTKIMYNVK
ncbi:MAG: hypothetical protein U5M51_16570 [Emticicia sp.]|nr:hypothetical protein [Emticicia sp.]